MPFARNPRAEADAVLTDGFEARVLEPSPPADLSDPDYLADDPTDPAGADATVVSPVPDGDLTWDEYAADHPEVADFTRQRWLGNLSRLGKLPVSYTETRQALHQVAFFAMAPRRHAANGKIGLRFTLGGFGTPFFGDDEQVRVEGALLVHQRGAEVRWTPITSVGAATEFLGLEYRVEWFEGFHDPLQPVDADAVLGVDARAAAALADWYGFATHVLERARRTPGAERVTRVQLWPEHHDPAFEMGDPEKGRRASYGASPGDGGIPEPYFYVAPWGEIDRSNPFWNSDSFGGAVLTHSELLGAEDQAATALDFLRRGHATLTS